MQKLIITGVLALFCVGCATQSQVYYWGNYENLLYKTYAMPGEAEPGVQIEKLTTDIKKAEGNGKPVPPGVHAHLGMMYAAQGNIELATAAFVQEKTLYPEASVLVDGMMSRAMKGQQP